MNTARISPVEINSSCETGENDNIDTKKVLLESDILDYGVETTSPTVPQRVATAKISLVGINSDLETGESNYADSRISSLTLREEIQYLLEPLGVRCYSRSQCLVVKKRI